MTTLTLRNAVATDCQVILAFIRELAAYERLEDQVVATVADIETSLFGPHATTHGVIVEQGGEAVGFAIYFYNFSTFLGKRGIYIEDVYVSPTHRGQGAGKLVFDYLAAQAVREGCGRLEWWVLDWNTPAIDFYKRLGAVAMDEWTVYRIEGPALTRLAEEYSHRSIAHA